MKKLKGRNILNKVLSITPIILLIVIWQIAAMLGLTNKLLPSPYAIYIEATRIFTVEFAGNNIWMHIYYSMKRVLIAYGLAFITGLPLGLYMGWNRTFDKIVKPIFELLRPIPPIAWIPLAILWLGIGEGPKIFICYIGSFVIFVLNSYTGMRYTDKLLIDATRTYGATRKQQFFNVALPASLPSIFAGVQNALSMSWMCVLAAEMVGAREGIGYIILNGMDLNRPAMIIVGMIIIGIIGTILAIAMRWLERVMCPWRRDLV